MLKLIALGVFIAGGYCQGPDCSKELSSCPAPGECKEHIKDNFRVKCLEVHKVQDECKCSCDLCIKCGKCKPPAPTTPPPDSPPPKKHGCFSPDSVVTTNIGQMTIQQLSEHRDVQIEVMQPDGTIGMGQLWFWNHKNSVKETKYLKIDTEFGPSLELTHDHLAYKMDCHATHHEAVFARRLNVGDCIPVVRHGKVEPSKVVKIDHITKLGHYSVVTETGNLVVNGAVASSYNTIESERAQHLFFSACRQILELFPGSVKDFFYTGFEEPWMVIDSQSYLRS